MLEKICKFILEGYICKVVFYLVVDILELIMGFCCGMNFYISWLDVSFIYNMMVWFFGGCNWYEEKSLVVVSVI